jgi:signal transduction histidine kinase
VIDLAECLNAEQKNLVDELQNVATGIDHIKEIVGAQQKHAKQGDLREKLVPSELFENTIAMGFGTAGTGGIEIVREYEKIEAMALDRHKILQILINLLSNAKKAVAANGRDGKTITLIVRKIARPDGTKVQFKVSDNGVGIDGASLTKIFGHGFTTRPDGHGFGLHSAANAAAEMGGKLTADSEGRGKGATFTLEVPAENVSSAEKVLSKRAADRAGAEEAVCLQ